MTNPTILKEIKDGIALVTLNRPQVMNALSFEMVETLEQSLADMRFDPDIRVVIITGAGEKAFCAGADLKERVTMSPDQIQAFLDLLRRVFGAVEQHRKPVIAAINGVALGGGLEIALAADIRLASQTAVLGLTETRLAIIPCGGGTQRLPRLIGKGKAKELILTGRRVDSTEALAIGLVNHVFPAGELLSRAYAMAAEICKAGPIAVQQAKYAINAGLECDLQTGLSVEANAYQMCLPTQDRLEGLAAFAEKRQPLYSGK